MKNAECRMQTGRAKPAKATARPPQSVLIARGLRLTCDIHATLKPPQCDPKATPMRPQSHPTATSKPPTCGPQGTPTSRASHRKVPVRRRFTVESARDCLGWDLVLACRRIKD